MSQSRNVDRSESIVQMVAVERSNILGQQNISGDQLQNVRDEVHETNGDGQSESIGANSENVAVSNSQRRATFLCEEDSVQSRVKTPERGDIVEESLAHVGASPLLEITSDQHCPEAQARLGECKGDASVHVSARSPQCYPDMSEWSADNATKLENKHHHDVNAMHGQKSRPTYVGGQVERLGTEDVAEIQQVDGAFKEEDARTISKSEQDNIGNGISIPLPRESDEDSDDVVIPGNFFQEETQLVTQCLRPEEYATVGADNCMELVHQDRKLSINGEVHNNNDVPARDERGRIINPDKEADECVDLLLKLGCEVPNPSLTKANIIAQIQEMQRPNSSKGP